MELTSLGCAMLVLEKTTQAFNVIAKGLRMRGIDVTISPEEGLIGASDKEQLAYGLSQG